jgi:hypothetical protein
MKRNVLFFLALTSFAVASLASPTPSPSRKGTSSRKQAHKQNHKSTLSEQLILSANGWSYENGVWVHPEGYKYVNREVLRTTARIGRVAPMPPGKVALDNAQKLSPKTGSTQAIPQTEAEKKAEQRRKNLTPRPASQTGSHIW